MYIGVPERQTCVSRFDVSKPRSNDPSPTATQMVDPAAKEEIPGNMN